MKKIIHLFFAAIVWCGLNLFSNDSIGQCANLTPYQPGGWDDKIVVSTVTGTGTTSSTINNQQTLYVDVAVLNTNGSCNSGSFTSKLYIDNVLRWTWNYGNLGGNSFSPVNDAVIAPLSAGSHTFRFVTDADGNVNETNESDNSYSRVITVSTCANLEPYLAPGFDNKLVVSTVTGTSTSASTIYSNQNVYVDWSIVNSGNCAITQPFSAKLYVDGIFKYNYDWQSFNANTYSNSNDNFLGQLSVGSHTIQIVMDANGTIGETNEGDNSYTRTINVVAPPCANLTPYQPSGWDNKIVLSTVNGTTTSSTTFPANQPIYLDYAFENNGSCVVSQTFNTHLYIDGIYQTSFSQAGLNSSSWAGRTDVVINGLTAGSHTIEIRVDGDGNVNETNESDNIYSRTINVTTPCANLTNYVAPGFDDKIVISTVTGTSTSAATILSNQTLYVDWSIINSGTCNVTQPFSVKLYVDGAFLYNYDFNTGFNANTYSNSNDNQIGPLSAGSHTITVVVDQTGTVPETNETDNTYSRTFNVSAPPCANIIPYQAPGWDDKIVLSTTTGTNTSASSFNASQNIYLDWAMLNNGTCNINQSFLTRVYIDGNLFSAYNFSALNSNAWNGYTDINIGTLSAGTHTIQVTVDAGASISETNENDNSYSRTITVGSASCVNLTPYQHTGWDNQIVLSTTTGTNTSASSFTTSQTIYVDWGVINNGGCNINNGFVTKFYIDNVLQTNYTTASLQAGYYTSVLDIAIGPLSAGTHTIKIVADGDANITESNEMDNSYERTFNVTSGTCPTATVSTVFNGNRSINPEFISASNNWRLYDKCQTAIIHTRDWNSTNMTMNPLEITSTNNSWTTQNQRFGGTAHWAAKESYKYFLNTHARQSWNNSNGLLNVYVNAAFNNSGNTANASMLNGTMKVGLGTAATLADSWCPLDIIGHEYAHDVTGTSAGLIYANESGALNESFSDIFGECIENATFGSNDWLFGAERSSGALRNLSNPSAMNHPDTYGGVNWVTDPNFDFGGVHINSGVQNLWFFLLCQGGSGTNDNGDAYNVTGIGMTKARAIAYRNLTQYLTASSNFAAARAGSIQAAEDLYGINSVEAETVKKAWCAVGVGTCAAACVTPGAVTVAGGGITCGVAILTASGGSGGTMYYQGTTPNGQSTANPTSSWGVNQSGTYYFRAMNACGIWGPEGSATVVRNNPPNTFTGAISTTWETPGNWSCNAVPDASQEVVISSGTVNINSNVTVRKLMVSPSATVRVKTGYSLKVTN